MAAGDCYLLQVQLLVDSRKVTLNFHYRQTGGADDINNATDLTDAFETNVRAALASCLSDNITFQCLYAQRLAGADPNPPNDPINKPGIPNELQYQNTVRGTVPGDSLPANHGPVLKLIQTSVDSKHNGRIFVPGVAEGSVIDGQLDPVFVTGVWAALKTALLATIVSTLPAAAQFALVVLSRVVGGVPRPVPVDNIVTDIITPSTLKNQRRRTTKKTGFAG